MSNNHNPSIKQRGGIAIHVNGFFAIMHLPYTFEHDIEPSFQLGVPITKLRKRLDDTVSRNTLKKWRDIYNAEQATLQSAAARREFNET